MIIILEGCDCAGKSTLAKSLSECLNYKVVQGSSFEKANNIEELYWDSVNLIERNKDLIIDRFVLSNMVYAPLYGYPTFHPEWIEHLSDLIIKHNVLTLYLDPPISIITQRMEQRGDKDIPLQDIEEIKRLYDEAIKYVEFPVQRIFCS